MQKLEDGSQGQEIVEEPAVTETTLSPEEDPKMVGEWLMAAAKIGSVVT